MPFRGETRGAGRGLATAQRTVQLFAEHATGFRIDFSELDQVLLWVLCFLKVSSLVCGGVRCRSVDRGFFIRRSLCRNHDLTDTIKYLLQTPWAPFVGIKTLLNALL